MHLQHKPKLCRSREKSTAFMNEHSYLTHIITINEFFFDLRIKWELLGYDQWTELINMDGAQFADEIAMPIFGYFLKWADKSMSFVIMYCPDEHKLYEGIRELQAIDVRGDEPAWNWRRHLNIDNLYAEAEEQSYSGKESGLIIPTWVNILDLSTC